MDYLGLPVGATHQNVPIGTKRNGTKGCGYAVGYGGVTYFESLLNLMTLPYGDGRGYSKKNAASNRCSKRRKFLLRSRVNQRLVFLQELKTIGFQRIISYWFFVGYGLFRMFGFGLSGIGLVCLTVTKVLNILPGKKLFRRTYHCARRMTAPHNATPSGFTRDRTPK